MAKPSGGHRHLPGRHRDYGAVCFIPGADGQPHVASGMAVRFTVA